MTRSNFIAWFPLSLSLEFQASGEKVRWKDHQLSKVIIKKR